LNILPAPKARGFVLRVFGVKYKNHIKIMVVMTKDRKKEEFGSLFGNYAFLDGWHNNNKIIMYIGL